MGVMVYRIDPDKLTKIMSQRGVANLSVLAERSGVHRNTIRAYVKGEKSPYSSSFLAIVEQLKVEPEELIGESQTVDEPVRELLKLIAPVVSANPDVAFLLIGSRAKGSARKYSDIDIGVTAGSDPLDYKRYLAIRSDIEDLVDDFSWLVDVVNLDAAPSWFLEGMDYEVRFLAGNYSSCSFLMGVLNGIQKTRKESHKKAGKGKSAPRSKAA